MSRTNYALLSLTAAVLAFVVVVLGAYVRLSDAGLGCPDWPGCYGQLGAPSMSQSAELAQTYPERPLETDKAWKEMVHRYGAGTLGLVILALAVLAWVDRSRRLPRFAATCLLVLVVFQGLLGMWTVTLLLKPVVVMTHLLGGFAILSLLWLLWVSSNPHDAVLGRVSGMRGFHDLKDYPDAKTTPGLVLYRFDSNIVFYNADVFRDRIRSVIAASKTPVEWVVVDASSVNVVDATGLQKFDELYEELAARGIVLANARVKPHLDRFFKQVWAQKQQERHEAYTFLTLRSAVKAFNKRASANRIAAPQTQDTELPEVPALESSDPEPGDKSDEKVDNRRSS